MAWNHKALTIIYCILPSVFCGPLSSTDSVERETRAAKSGLQLPAKTNAIIYESPNFEGRKISFREDPSYFSHLRKYFSSSNFAPAIVCVSGVWLVYDKEGYQTSMDDQVKLVSGNDNCVVPSDMKIMSMQPVTTSTFSAEGTIALFSKRNFGSFAQSIRKEGGMKQIEDIIGSVITVGDTPWSLRSSSGKVVCVRPDPRESAQGLASICYGIDLHSVGSIPDFHVDAVSANCPPEHDPLVRANVRLTNCKNFGVEGFEVLSPPAMMGRSLGGGNGIVAIECPQNNNWTDASTSTNLSPEESELVAKLINISIEHDFSKKEQTLWPDNDQDIWKTILMDAAFDVAILTIPDELVQIVYLQKIREFTMFHLNEVWKAEGNSSDVKKDVYKWRSHKVIMHLLVTKCLQEVKKYPDQYKNIIYNEYRQVTSMEDFMKKIDPAFELNPEYDPVIEATWVVANYAMALCHEELKYSVNFWDNFVTTFHNLYFAPLQERWQNPTQIRPSSFRVILSGFGTSMQHKKLAFAATQIFNMIPNFPALDKNFK